MNSLLFAESSTVASLIREDLDQHRDKNTIKRSIQIKDEDFKKSDPAQLLALLSPYEKDENQLVRRFAYIYDIKIAKTHPTPQVRQEVTSRLLDAFYDRNFDYSGNIGGRLLEFQEKDFNTQSKNILFQAVTDEKAGAGTIKLCGVANITDALPILEELLFDEEKYVKQARYEVEATWYVKKGWDARLARARMGVQADIKKCIELIELEKNFHIRVTNLLHDVGYIRQPAAISVLKKYLDCDERLSPIEGHTLGEPVAGYVINILADCLTDFPIERREQRGYKAEEIQLCREWMAKQKEWNIRR